MISFDVSRLFLPKLCLAFSILLLFLSEDVGGCGDSDYTESDFSVINPAVGRSKREAGEEDAARKACQPGDPAPPTRVFTGARLDALRAVLDRKDISAFLVPSGDSHQSEYIAKYDKRREWIGGFSGGAGFAAVTLDQAAMWVDGRYYLQAEDELDCNWLFMKGEEGGDGGWVHWLGQVLPASSKVGADPTLTGASTWLKWSDQLIEQNLTLVPMLDNPIDEVWGDLDERPPRSKEPLEILDVKYAGLSWQKKMSDLRESLSDSGHDAIVLTALDEIAWLFNLRGRDIPYNPVFRAYGVISMDYIILYLPPEKQTRHVKNYLQAEDCRSRDCVQIKEYRVIFEELGELSEDWRKVLLGKKWAYTGGASYAIYQLIPESKLSFELSPVMLMKGRKNPTEVSGMQHANVKDAVALIDFVQHLERTIKSGEEEWDELKAAEVLKKKRMAQKLNKGLSFETISAYGANGAVIHYKPTNVTNTKIGRDNLYLLDSGGQYLDGTTDVTRTFHFGQPTEFQRSAYTRVLLGSIDLARATFLKGTPDTRVDYLARGHLFQAGLNYNHGTGHGIGAYGFIHESPIQVRIYAKEEHPFEVGQFFSDEPGYYQPGEFGIRLETVLRVVEKKGLLYQDKESYGTFLGFEPVCLVPFERNLIDFGLFDKAQLDWLNGYNQQIRRKVGKELKKQRKNRAYDWMMSRTEFISIDSLKTHQGLENNAGNNSGGSSWMAAVVTFLTLANLALSFKSHY